MQHDSIEKLRKHYRGAWIGTIGGFVFIVLLVLFAGEVGFSELFIGPRTLRPIAFNLATGGGFLAFLILNDRKQVDAIDRIRLPLMVGVVGYLLWFWLLGLTNRVNRSENVYERSVTVERIMLVHHRIQGVAKPIPTHWSVKVKDEAGRISTFDGPLAAFDNQLLGKQIPLSVIRGRLGQDFIAPFE